VTPHVEELLRSTDAYDSDSFLDKVSLDNNELYRLSYGAWRTMQLPATCDRSAELTTKPATCGATL